MALPSIAKSLPILNIEACQDTDCDSFNISESTGVYDSNGNPGGWGNPNYDVSDVIDARLIIVLPDGTSVTIDSNSSVPVFPTLPDSTGNSIFNVTSTMLGVSGLEDGIYNITYQVDLNSVFGQTIQAQVTIYQLLTCNIKCCVDKLVAKIPDYNCDCSNPAVENALLAQALYSALCCAGKCGNLTAVDNLLETLNRICDSTDCGCN